MISRRNYRDSNYADDLALLVNAPAVAESLQHNKQQ